MEGARSFIDGAAEDAAKVIAKAATASRPRTRYTIGRDAAILLRISRLSPTGSWTALCECNLGPLPAGQSAGPRSHA